MSQANNLTHNSNISLDLIVPNQQNIGIRIEKIIVDFRFL